MDFLKELDVSSKTVETIERIYNPDIIRNIDLYKDNVKENIVYLKGLGVNTIDEILTFDLTVLFQPISSTKDMIDTIGTDEVVSKLNEDPEFIQYLLK